MMVLGHILDVELHSSSRKNRQHISQKTSRNYTLHSQSHTFDNRRNYRIILYCQIRISEIQILNEQDSKKICKSKLNYNFWSTLL